MKTKHTKGEWIACKITNTTNCSVRTKERPELIIIPTNLTEVNETIHNDLLAEAIANAKLIAAAPDLLHACDAVLTAWHSKPPNMYRKEPAHLQQIRGAINKATE